MRKLTVLLILIFVAGNIAFSKDLQLTDLSLPILKQMEVSPAVGIKEWTGLSKDCFGHPVVVKWTGLTKVCYGHPTVFKSMPFCLPKLILPEKLIMIIHSVWITLSKIFTVIME